MDINKDKWEPPKIQDVDNLAFVLLRGRLYDFLHELHMAENYKIVNPEKDYNVYWDNFCNMIEYIKMHVDECVYRGAFDS